MTNDSLNNFTSNQFIEMKGNMESSNINDCVAHSLLFFIVNFMNSNTRKVHIA